MFCSSPGLWGSPSRAVVDVRLMRVDGETPYALAHATCTWHGHGHGCARPRARPEQIADEKERCRASLSLSTATAHWHDKGRGLAHTSTHIGTHTHTKEKRKKLIEGNRRSSKDGREVRISKSGQTYVEEYVLVGTQRERFLAIPVR